MLLTAEEWSLDHLQRHLDYAVELELWTIPYYMSAMYSIEDRASKAFRLVRTVFNQEMLHLQCVCNIVNAYGQHPSFRRPSYGGNKIPHLNFTLDNPNPEKDYAPWTTKLGPLDKERLNTMCLIEYPLWKTGRTPDLRSDTKEYGSIAEFYAALKYGAGLLTKHLRGGLFQVDHFGAYYRNLPSLIVTEDGELGFQQVALLIDLIREQGEGANPRIAANNGVISSPFQNTADDRIEECSVSHFGKFTSLRGDPAEQVHLGMPDPAHPTNDVLRKRFDELLEAFREQFSGRDPSGFAELMFSMGAAMHNCWRSHVIPSL